MEKSGMLGLLVLFSVTFAALGGAQEDVYYMRDNTCLDTDNGPDTKRMGYAYGWQNGEWRGIGDYCVDDEGVLSQQGNSVREHYCMNDNMAEKTIICPDGTVCDGGVCIDPMSPPEFLKCEDGTLQDRCSEGSGMFCRVDVVDGELKAVLRPVCQICGCGLGDCDYDMGACFQSGCLDGTPLGECSKDQPYLCAEEEVDGESKRVLRPVCEICGCPEGKKCDEEGSNCFATETCEDGTLEGECSETLPLFCTRDDYVLHLVPHCGWCGCGEGKTCYNITGECYYPQCDDGVDNDGDNKTDLEDPDCEGPSDDLEVPECKPILINGDPRDKVDIFFIGDGYEEFDSFSGLVRNMVDYEANSGFNGLMSREPFKSNRDKFNIWAVSSADLDAGESWVGNSPRLEQVVKFELGCPQLDITVVTSKNKVYRSHASFSGRIFLSNERHPFPIFSTVPVPDFMKGMILLHEFGHAFGNLADEYVENGLGDRPRQPNCAPNVEEARSWWGDLEGGFWIIGVSYFNGCSYMGDNIRPTFSSLMRTPFPWADYGPVNERHLGGLLEQYK